MISDYIDYRAVLHEHEYEGIKPTFDVWGTVLKASDNTEKGNVRVKIKTMKDSKDTFDNVPVLTAYGGGDYGAFFLPEEGDIVRITFIGGDFRHPVVTGCRFPASSQFVKNSHDEKNLKKAVKVKNGSTVMFSGEEGKEKIEVSGQKNMHLELNEEKQQIIFGDKENKNEITVDKKNGKTIIKAESDIRIECGKGSLEIKKDGTIVLSGEKLTLEAKTVQIQGKTRAEIKGQQLSITGNTDVSVEAKGQLKVSSKGQLKLSGAMIHLN